MSRWIPVYPRAARDCREEVRFAFRVEDAYREAVGIGPVDTRTREDIDNENIRQILARLRKSGAGDNQ